MALAQASEPPIRAISQGRCSASEHDQKGGDYSEQYIVPHGAFRMSQRTAPYIVHLQGRYPCDLRATQTRDHPVPVPHNQYDAPYSSQQHRTQKNLDEASNPRSKPFELTGAIPWFTRAESVMHESAPPAANHGRSHYSSAHAPCLAATPCARRFQLYDE